MTVSNDNSVPPHPADVDLRMVDVASEIVERGQESVGGGLGVIFDGLGLVARVLIVVVRPSQEELGVAGTGGSRSHKELQSLLVVAFDMYPLMVHHGDREHPVGVPELGRFHVALESRLVVPFGEVFVRDVEQMLPAVRLPLDIGVHQLLHTTLVAVHALACKRGYSRIVAYYAFLVSHIGAVLVPADGLQKARLHAVETVLVIQPYIQEGVGVSGDPY
jgi:hypothetical protein